MKTQILIALTMVLCAAWFLFKGVGFDLAMAVSVAANKTAKTNSLTPLKNFIVFSIDAMKKELDDFGKALDQRIEKANESAKEGNKIASETKSELDNLSKKWNDLNEQLHKRINDLNIDIKSAKQVLASGTKSAAELFTDVLSKSDAFKSFQKNRDGRVSIEVPEIKAIMLPSTHAVGSAAGPIIQPQLIPGIVAPNIRNVNVRSAIPVGSTDSDRILYIEEGTWTDGSAMVAAGDVKPQSDVTFTTKDSLVRKIATHLRLAEEMIDDVPFITSYVAQRAPAKLRLVEDNQVLYGAGTGNNLKGLTVSATAFTTPLTAATPNELDVLIAAVHQVTLKEYSPSAIFLHPTDVAKMKLLKNTQGNYLFPELWNINSPSIMGIPTFVNTAMTAGKFLVGDFQLGCQLFDRKGLSVQFYNQDQDNAIRNLVTIVIEERLALVTYRPDAFSYGDFAAAKTAMTAV